MKATTTITLLAALAITAALISACASTGGGGTPQAAPRWEPPRQQEPPAPAQPDRNAPRQQTAPAPSAGTGGSTLEQGIAQIGRDIAAALPEGRRVAAVGFASPSPHFSDYALDELQGALQNSGRLIVVERAQLDAVRRELGLQYSGDVDDASAVSLGKFLGAQAVITGSLTPLGGENCRIRFTAIDVETAVRKASHAVTVRVDPVWGIR